VSPKWVGQQCCSLRIYLSREEVLACRASRCATTFPCLPSVPIARGEAFEAGALDTLDARGSEEWMLEAECPKEGWAESLAEDAMEEGGWES